MTKHLRFTLLLALVLTTCLHAEIRQATKFADIAHEFAKADRNTLAIFDVDDVLIMGTNDYRFTHPLRRNRGLSSKKRFSQATRQLLISIIWENRKVRLVDPDIVKILADLKRRHIPTVALTNMYTEKFGRIEAVEDWRIKELAGMGIDFAAMTPFKAQIVLRKLDQGNGAPMLKAGIILTGMLDKAEVLEGIFSTTGYYPKAIIFVDDNLDNVQSLQTLCDRLGIKFLGVHFTAAALVPQPELDEKTEETRFKILETEHQWVTDLDTYKQAAKDCLFCNLGADRNIKENELFFVTYDKFPVTKYHTLFIPKRHIKDYFQLNRQEITAFNDLLHSMKSEIQAKDPSVTGFNVGMNCGEDAGQTVMHCHIHLIPRRKGDTENPRGGVRGVIPSKQSY